MIFSYDDDNDDDDNNDHNNDDDNDDDDDDNNNENDDNDDDDDENNDENDDDLDQTDRETLTRRIREILHQCYKFGFEVVFFLFSSHKSYHHIVSATNLALALFSSYKFHKCLILVVPTKTLHHITTLSALQIWF